MFIYSDLFQIALESVISSYTKMLMIKFFIKRFNQLFPYCLFGKELFSFETILANVLSYNSFHV